MIEEFKYDTIKEILNTFSGSEL
ncbi:MAG: hypothetical protein QG641_2850, partial [Candidatus Poribacteria bacterium]|nr:hypothetical protein [Candidatus Poribacteria bacterium]